MQKELKDFTEVELKAMVYDQLITLESCQNNIKVINQELSSRAQPVVKEEEEVKDEE